jgi:hypothetical protein
MAMRVFAEVQAWYRQPLQLSHEQKVTRLYRRSLRLLDSWAVNRNIFNAQANEIRKRFDANKAVDAHSGCVNADAAARAKRPKWGGLASVCLGPADFFGPPEKASCVRAATPRVPPRASARAHTRGAC